MNLREILELALMWMSFGVLLYITSQFKHWYSIAFMLAWSIPGVIFATYIIIKKKEVKPT
jgi:preprotein translocase subunit SecF